MLALILQAVGVAGVAVGVGLYSLPAGVIIAGVGCILFGLAIERGRK